MTVQQSTRNRNREAELANAIHALEAEVEDLRTTLVTALAEFEMLIDESLVALPDWADINHSELRELYAMSIGGDDVTIGPGAASLAAARLESFVNVWLLSDDRPEHFGVADIEAWAAEASEVVRLLEEVAAGGQKTARTANERLARVLEDLVADVADSDSSGEVDPTLDALKAKLRRGKLGAALLTRESQADRLEAQRKKTEEVQEAWVALEQLADAGADMGIDAAERMGVMFKAAVQTLVVEYPELADVAANWVEAPKPPAKKSPPPLPPVTVTLDIRDVAVVTPKKAGESNEVEPPALPSAVRAESELEALEVESEPAVEPEPEVESEPEFESEPAVELEAEVASEPEIAAEVASEPEIAAEAEVASEPEGEPEPKVQSNLAEEVGLAAETEPSSHADGEAAAEPSPEKPVSEPALKKPRVRVDTDAPRTAQDTPLAPASATATMEVIASQRQFREPAFRTVSAWKAAGGSEVALALGPPTVYVVGMTALTLAYQLGMWSSNPFEAWPWALPVFFAFGVWAVGMPALYGWRVEWVGAWPRPMRFSERPERGFAEIDELSVEIESYSFDFRTSTAELGRWREGNGRGWTLVLTNDDDRVARFASDGDSERWNDSNATCGEAEPDGAWRISEEALLHLVDECASRKARPSR